MKPQWEKGQKARENDKNHTRKQDPMQYKKKLKQKPWLNSLLLNFPKQQNQVLKEQYFPLEGKDPHVYDLNIKYFIFNMWWIVVLLPCVLTIRFEYELVKHEFMCFSEEVEKQTRYQIIVKGEKASYLLQVFQSEQSIHQNSDGQMYMKYYSAYAQLNDNILFCIGNMDVDEGNLVEIQFYHGMHLEEEGGMKGIEAIVENLQHMQNFIKISYSMHSQSLLYRQSLLEQIVVVLSVLVFVFFFLVLVTRYCVLTRTIRYLKHRKII